MKAPDKQDLCRKVIGVLKPRYGPAEKQSLSVIETMLFAVCLEGVSSAQARQAYSRLTAEFHDLNEVRVSSVYELQRLFAGFPDPELRSLRIKNILQYVFEKTYSFEFEVLRRQTQEKALKDLSKIKWLSQFCRAYTQQNSLDAHVLPLDDRQAQALRWVGLAEPDASTEHVAESLKPFVRKADAQLFCHLLRCLCTDPDLEGEFDNVPGPEDTRSPVERLQSALSGGRKGRRKDKPDASRDRKPARSNGKATPPAKAHAPKAQTAVKKPAPARMAKSSPKKK